MELITFKEREKVGPMRIFLNLLVVRNMFGIQT